MVTSVGWQIRSMNSLSLFDRVELDSLQVAALPERIRQTIYQGYSDVLNHPRMAALEPSALTQIQFAAKTTSEGDILVSYDRGATYVNAGSLKEFPKLVQGMRQACDASRIQFPSAFKREAPIGPMQDFPDELGSSTPELRGIGLGVNSVLRNGFCAAKICAPFVALSGFTAGALGVKAGLDNMKEGNRKYAQATLIGDGEGLIQAALGITMGVFCEMVAFGMVGAFLPSAYDLLPGFTDFPLDLGRGYGEFADGSQIAMSLALAASTLYEWRYVSQFRGDLGRILERDLPEQTKAIQGLEFLQQHLSLSAEDWGDLADKGLERNTLAIYNKTREKYDRFVRRVGPVVAARVAQSAKLVAAIKEGSPEALPEVLQEAKELIELADLESFKKRVKEITCLVISILTMAAAILSLIAAGDLAPHILYAINAICWISVDSSSIHNSIAKAVYGLLKPTGEKRWGHSVENAVDQTSANVA